ncbi:MAG TPA: hypothetical protein V6D14_26575 [Coleofasciculaceae cyanobacterium]
MSFAQNSGVVGISVSRRQRSRDRRQLARDATPADTKLQRLMQVAGIHTCTGGRQRRSKRGRLKLELLPLTVPEVRRLLVALVWTMPPPVEQTLHWHW